MKIMEHHLIKKEIEKRFMEYLKLFDTVQVIDSAEVTNDIFPSGIISQSALNIADSFGIPTFGFYCYAISYIITYCSMVWSIT